MDGPNIPPQPDFLVQLRRTQHAVRNRLDAELAATGLTMPQYTVLAALDREGDLSSSDLARELGMTVQTVNVLVKGLETAGLLRRTRHPSHGRILLAELTARGRRALARGYGAGKAVQDRMLSGVSRSDRALLLRLLKTIERRSIIEKGVSELRPPAPVAGSPPVARRG
jgi:DNA-binding MarR family transcriptional regulator